MASQRSKTTVGMDEDAEPGGPAALHRSAPAIGIFSVAVTAVLAGALGAAAAVTIRLGFRGLEWLLTGSSADLPEAAAHLSPGRRACTPALGALLATAVLSLARASRQRRGRNEVPYVEYAEAVQQRHGLIPLEPNLWRTGSAAFSVGTGAAVGREGSMIQFAAAVASSVGRLPRWRASPMGRMPFPLVVACGVAGGVTAAYNAPLAAAFFALEIVLGFAGWAALPWLGLASGAGWLVSATVLGPSRLYPAPAALPTGIALWFLPLLAIAAALLGPVYLSLLGSLRGVRRWPVPLLWGALVVGALSIPDVRVWGNADAALRAALGMGSVPSVADLAQVLGLRLAATSACVWTGTVGGVFTPTLFAGGALGALASRLLPHLVSGAAERLWAIAGMSFFLAAVTHAPFMAAFMAVELTGNWHLLPVLLPLNLGAWWVASRLSSQAMYAIASQSPADGHAAQAAVKGKLNGR